MGFEWKDLAEDFSERQRAIVGDAFYERVERALSGWKNLGETLEIACGDGEFTEVVAPAAKGLVATDVEKAMCRAAEKRLARFPHVEVSQANLYDLPFEDESFDSVLALNILHVLPDRAGALKEARRVLRPDGRLLLMDFGMDGMTKAQVQAMAARYVAAFGPVESKKQPVTFDDLVGEVEAAGFKVLSQERLCDPMGAALVLEARERSGA